ncbi:MAG TPA: NADP-dependent oxidoreductase [Acidimicrobiales bacterium]|nr:NADP-dependent oxidoreductase [Acidimicrobiales bacterium]
MATAFGGPEVLSLTDVTVGPPGPEHVLVEVRAAAVNPIDYKVYSGARGADPSKLPMRIGYEASGVVKALADGALGPAGPLKVGDEVIAYPVQGAYASEIVAPAASALPKPTTLSFEQASGLMLTGVTAFHALTVVRAGKGDTVVVHGAAGGVGLMVVQLAVNLGARVIGTAGVGGHGFLHQFGAEPVVYGEGLLERIRALAPDGVDAAVDTVGTDEAIDVSLALVPDRERIVSIAAFQRGPGLGIKVIGNGPGADPGTEIRRAARLELLRLVEEGSLRVVVSAIYPLYEAGAAHQAAKRGHTHGKIVLVP